MAGIRESNYDEEERSLLFFLKKIKAGLVLYCVITTLKPVSSSRIDGKVRFRLAALP